MNNEPKQIDSNSEEELPAPAFAPEVSPQPESDVRKPGFLRRMASKVMDAANGPIPDEAPLGYTEDGTPKKVTPVTIIDPSGKEPSKTIHFKNW